MAKHLAVVRLREAGLRQTTAPLPRAGPHPKLQREKRKRPRSGPERLTLYIRTSKLTLLDFPNSYTAAVSSLILRSHNMHCGPSVPCTYTNFRIRRL